MILWTIYTNWSIFRNLSRVNKQTHDNIFLAHRLLTFIAWLETVVKTWAVGASPDELEK